jgi:hypothetical protein
LVASKAKLKLAARGSHAQSDERDYPRVSGIRRYIAAIFSEDQIFSLLHKDVMNRIEAARKTSLILFIKTTRRFRTPRFICVWIAVIGMTKWDGRIETAMQAGNQWQTK